LTSLTGKDFFLRIGSGSFTIVRILIKIRLK
jgi:hypothetical protein